MSEFGSFQDHYWKKTRVSRICVNLLIFEQFMHSQKSDIHAFISYPFLDSNIQFRVMWALKERRLPLGLNRVFFVKFCSDMFEELFRQRYTKQLFTFKLSSFVWEFHKSLGQQAKTNKPCGCQGPGHRKEG